MAIYEKIRGGDEGGYPKIKVHEFSAAMFGYLTGRFGAGALFSNVDNLVNAVGTDANGNPEDRTEVDAIKAAHDLLSTEVEKLDYRVWLWHVCLQSELGKISTRTMWQNQLDITI